MAQNKFHESGLSLQKITTEVKGETILVPLTGSMYVPGTITDIDHVIIDIGTGYYVQKVSHFTTLGSESLLTTLALFTLGQYSLQCYLAEDYYECD